MLSDIKKEVLSLFGKGRELYKQRAFSEAAEYFAKALELDEKDGPSRIYRDRCLAYLKNPPPSDWDGVFVMTSK